MTHVVAASASLDDCGDEEKHSPDGGVNRCSSGLGDHVVFQKYLRRRDKAEERQSTKSKKAPGKHRRAI